jgi:CBS domain-containing membrane protein
MRELSVWLKGFIPLPIGGGNKEKLLACIGAAIGLMVTEWISRATLGGLNPWFIAPMGASAVLLFAVPMSPLAQPWSLLGGNFLSAVIGVTCARYIGDPALAASAAVALAIGAMFALRCLHPPSGAVALTAVLGGPAVVVQGYHFAFSPVLANSALLLVAALVFNNMSRRRYPHPVTTHANQHRTSDPRPVERVGFTRADLDEALKSHGEILDINEEDLEELLVQAELRAFARHSGGIRCEHIMSKDVVSAHEAMSVASAWALLARHRVHAIPVVDSQRRLLGIVTMHDLIAEHAADIADQAELPRLRSEQQVGQAMNREVQVVRPEQSISDLIPSFSDEGFHHLPVVDDARHVVGMVTQSDLIAALFRARLDETTRIPAPMSGRA